MPVRLEVIDANGRRPWGLWEFDAEINVVTPAAQISTNRLRLRHGLGSALLGIDGDGPVEIEYKLGPLAARKVLVDVTGQPWPRVVGTLPGSSTVWSNVVQIIGDLVVPSGHTLTLQPGTLLLIDGTSSGSTAPNLIVNGSIQSLGTAADPIVLTCTSTGANWGQLRHQNAQTSLYRHTFLSRGGRATPEGHTGTGPLIRTANSPIRFEHCSFTDVSVGDPANTTGKILYGAGGASADLLFDDCHWARARMGPEITGSTVLATNCHVAEMIGPDDADGIYLHNQGAGQFMVITDSVWAGGGDDGIDTLDSTVTITNCLVRGWNNPAEDAKGVSVFGGETRLWNSLIVDCTVALSSKASNGGTVATRIDHSTIIGIDRGVAAENKDGAAPNATVLYSITNSIVLATGIPTNALYTDYNPTNLVIQHSLLGEIWQGDGNSTGDPLFVDTANHDFRLRPGSPAIDTGDPARPMDPDGSGVERGYFAFVPPSPMLLNPRTPAGGGFTFDLAAYPGRNYRLERSSDLVTWLEWRTNYQDAASVEITDPEPAGADPRYFRALVFSSQ